MLLRLVQGNWPPDPIPASKHEAIRNEILLGYSEWMRDVRGLAPSTREDRLSEALRFLSSLGRSGDESCLNAISVSNIDAYVKSRSVSRRSRASLKLATIDLRSFLRYLKVSGRIERDFSEAVVGPKCYKLEGVPFALQAKEVSSVLEAVRADHSPIGRRDYAILTLLATYGLRACEITRLRLEDIDWKNGVLRVRHAKTSICSELPLEPEPGNAIVAYLRHGRPKTDVREVFVRTVAPYVALAALTTQIRERLATVGAVAAGRRGPHAFRHARAASLLRAGVPIKTIGDVLGHRSSDSTASYLKLAVDDLRMVALEIPSEVSP